MNRWADVEDIAIRIDWGFFEQTLRHRSRFLSRSADFVLHNIFDGLESLRTRLGEPVIVEAGPGRKIASLFRGHIAPSVEAMQQFLLHPYPELSAPFPLDPARGLVNAKGISAFYGAMSYSGVLAEMRPPLNSLLAVVEFSLTRKLRLLDVDALRTSFSETEDSHEVDSDAFDKAEFIEKLNERLMRRKTQWDDELDDLPLQVVAEYLMNHSPQPLDGLFYQAAPFQPSHRNVVLFHNAARAELWAGHPADEHKRPYSLRFQNDSLAVYQVEGAAYETRKLPLTKHKPHRACIDDDIPF